MFLEVSSFEDILLLHDKAKDYFGKALNAIEYLDSDSYELVRAVKSQNYIFPFKKPSGKKPFYLLIEFEGSDDQSETEDRIERFYTQNSSLIRELLVC